MNCYKLETEGHIEYWRKGKLHRDNKELGRKRIMDIKIILILSSILVSLVLIIIRSGIKKDFDIGICLIPLTVGIAISLLITIMKIIESKNTVQSIGGDGYYWLQAPKVSYKLKLNEEVKIPIKICTPNEVHLEQIKEEMSNKIFDKNIIELSNAEKKELDEAFSTFLTVKKSLNYQTHDIRIKIEQEEKILEINEFFIDENTKTYSIKALKNGNAVIWFYIGDISTCVFISVEEEDAD